MDYRLNLRWLLAILWMGLIFYLSAQPFSTFPPLVPDWMVHLFLYAVLALFLWLALNRAGSGQALSFRNKNLTVSLLTVVLTILYGFSDEIHQIFVPTRTFSLVDLAVDGLAALLAVALLTFFKSRTFYRSVS